MPAQRPRNRARPYHRSDRHTVERALPHLMERIAAAAVPDAALSPVEQASRAWSEPEAEDAPGALRIAPPAPPTIGSAPNRASGHHDGDDEGRDAWSRR